MGFLIHSKCDSVIRLLDWYLAEDAYTCSSGLHQVLGGIQLDLASPAEEVEVLEVVLQILSVVSAVMTLYDRLYENY